MSVAPALVTHETAQVTLPMVHLEPERPVLTSEPRPPTVPTNLASLSGTATGDNRTPGPLPEREDQVKPTANANFRRLHRSPMRKHCSSPMFRN